MDTQVKGQMAKVGRGDESEPRVRRMLSHEGAVAIVRRWINQPFWITSFVLTLYEFQSV
jgi:hypothetical protein